LRSKTVNNGHNSKLNIVLRHMVQFNW